MHLQLGRDSPERRTNFKTHDKNSIALYANKLEKLGKLYRFA